MSPSTPAGAPPETAASEALRQLLRAANTLRTYPANNAMSRRALDALLPALEKAAPVELSVSADRVHCGETLLLEPDEKRTGLFARLYGDGIRKIRIEADLEREEVERLVLALATPLDPEDLREDYVTRLWEAELPHVRVAAVDPYLDTEFEEDVLEGKERPHEEQEDVGRARDPEAPAPPMEAFRVGEEAAENVAAEVESARAQVPWESFLRAITETFSLPPGNRRVEECVHLLEATFQRLIEPPTPRLGLARSVLHWLREGSPAHAHELLRPAVVRMSDPERLAPLHEALEEGLVDGPTAAALLADFGPRGAEVALALLARSSTPEARRAYPEVLVQVGRPALRVALAAFGRGDPERDALLARAIGRIHAPEAAPPLVKRLRAGPPVELRRELVRALAGLESADGAKALVEVALGDADGPCRVLALRGLGHSRARIGHGPLLERIRSRGFASVREEEKDLLFEALGAVSSDAVVPALARMLRPRWLGGASPEDRRRAARALATLGSEPARSVLERGARSRLRRSHAALCGEQLRRLEDEGGGPGRSRRSEEEAG